MKSGLTSKQVAFGQRAGIVCCVLLPVVVVWIRSGRGYEERWFMPVLAVLVLILGFIFGRKEAGDEFSRKRGLLVSVLLDPVFWAGLLFLSLLVVQWFNSGRDLVFDEASFKWIYGPPPHPGWPSGFTRGESDQMLCWYFPAWILLLFVRHWKWTERSLRGILLVLFANAVLLAIFGIVQYATGTRLQYWYRPLRRHFFSVFPYSNHAASFFVMMASVGTGLFLAVFRLRGKWGGKVLLACGIFPCIFGALLSLSRAGILMALFLGIVIVVYFIVRYVRFMSLAQQINSVLSVCALLTIMAYGTIAFAGERIQRELIRAYEELKITRLVDPHPRSLTGIRYPLWVTAWHIYQDYPVFGCGGWGYRYLRQIYLPVEKQVAKYGFANVHLDGLNLLVEFGAIGYALILLAVGVSGRYIFRRCCRGDPLRTFILLGLGLVVLHSIIDLPFRCPAILYYWLVIWAVANELCRRQVMKVTLQGISHEQKFD